MFLVTFEWPRGSEHPKTAGTPPQLAGRWDVRCVFYHLQSTPLGSSLFLILSNLIENKYTGNLKNTVQEKIYL